MQIEAVAQIYDHASFYIEKYSLWVFQLRRTIHGESYWERDFMINSRGTRYTDRFAKQQRLIYLGLFRRTQLEQQRFQYPKGTLMNYCIRFEESHLCK